MGTKIHKSRFCAYLNSWYLWNLFSETFFHQLWSRCLITTHPFSAFNFPCYQIKVRSMPASVLTPITINKGIKLSAGLNVAEVRKACPLSNVGIAYQTIEGPLLLTRGLGRLVVLKQLKLHIKQRWNWTLKVTNFDAAAFSSWETVGAEEVSQSPRRLLLSKSLKCQGVIQ